MRNEKRGRNKNKVPQLALTYTVGYEHSSRSVDGGPVEPSTLRVTHVYRRENGEWKIVHQSRNG